MVSKPVGNDTNAAVVAEDSNQKAVPKSWNRNFMKSMPMVEKLLRYWPEKMLGALIGLRQN